MRIWLYGRTAAEVRALLADIDAPDIVTGTSIRAVQGAAFPQSGLTPAMYAAICGEIDALVITAPDLLGDRADEAENMRDLFHRCGVSVRSASSFASKSS